MTTLSRFVVIVAVVAGLATLVAGGWAFTSPASFARAVAFPEHEHFLHDVGAFQVGLGLLLLLGVVWGDALGTALAASLAANVLHTASHVIDSDLGGAAWQTWSLAAVSVALGVALWQHLRRLGYVVGRVAAAAEPRLAEFVRQKTVSLTTFRRDGTPGATPVSIAVEGDHAYFRSFEKSLKTRRIARDERVEVAPSRALGVPTGAPVKGAARRLAGAESRHAARMLRAKYPFLHGVLVPLSHRLGRAKTGGTAHFEVRLR